MENNDRQSGFNYSYSAKEQEELKRIREKYTTPEKKTKNNIERLRRLDSRVTQKAQSVSLIFGVLGTLILGLGMSLAMTDLAEKLGLFPHISMLLGIAIGIVGIILTALAYPIYNLVIKRERKKIAPEIIRLTDTLMK